MALHMIGDEFDRTGTESLKRAPEMPGFGPRYHMFEVYSSTLDWPATEY